MSINDLVKEETQRQIDLAIEEIPSDSLRLTYVQLLSIGKAISNGTLDGNNIDLSVEGDSCLYLA